MKGLIRHMQDLKPGKKELLSQVFQLAQYYLVMPVLLTHCVHAVSDRSFSVLRRIKTYLRNTVTKEEKKNKGFCEVS